MKRSSGFICARCQKRVSRPDEWELDSGLCASCLAGEDNYFVLVRLRDLKNIMRRTRNARHPKDDE